MLKIRPSHDSLCRPLRRWPYIVALLAAFAVGGPSLRADEKITWQKDYSAGVHESVASKKPMLIVVGTDWCGYCKKLFQQTLPNPSISALVNEQFIPVMIDADKHQELAQKLRVEGMPTLLVVSPDRKILRRINGFQSVAELNTQLAPFKKTEPSVAAK